MESAGGVPLPVLRKTLFFPAAVRALKMSEDRVKKRKTQSTKSKLNKTTVVEVYESYASANYFAYCSFLYLSITNVGQHLS